MADAFLNSFEIIHKHHHHRRRRIMFLLSMFIVYIMMNTRAIYDYICPQIIRNIGTHIDWCLRGKTSRGILCSFIK